jgi:hypothetical protein
VVGRIPRPSQADDPAPTELAAAPWTRPRLTLWQVVTRHPLAVVLPAVLGLAAGLAVAASRPTVYSASAVLAVEQLNANSPGALAGYAQAAPKLAETYSRGIVAESVVTEVASRTGATTAQVHSRLSANPVPSTPVLHVQGRGPTADGAVAMANAGSEALVSYVAVTGSSTEVSDSLFARYEIAALALQRALARRDDAEGAYRSETSTATRKALLRARAAVEAAQLKVDTLRANYQLSQQGEAGSNPLQVVSPATNATSDRLSKMQLFGFLGLLAGVVVGLAVAVLLGSRAARRAWA